MKMMVIMLVGLLRPSVFGRLSFNPCWWSRSWPYDDDYDAGCDDDIGDNDDDGDDDDDDGGDEDDTVGATSQSSVLPTLEFELLCTTADNNGDRNVDRTVNTSIELPCSRYWYPTENKHIFRIPREFGTYSTDNKEFLVEQT